MPIWLRAWSCTSGCALPVTASLSGVCRALAAVCAGEIGHRWFGVDRFRLMIRSRDYGPRDGSPLLPWIRQQLATAGLPADGEVWLQTFPRVFGYAFNPVSFWYCHDSHGQLIAVLADVNNTFGEHHAYLLANPMAAPSSTAALSCRKLLHVSPFCQVAGHYRSGWPKKATAC
jgi:DUF1365 family protein